MIEFECFRSLGDAELERACRLPEFVRIYAIAGERAGITDAAGAAIACFRELTHLDLRFTRFGDCGLSQLGCLTCLTIVDLDATRITDDSIDGLRGSLESLEEVSLSYTNVGDGAVELLSGAPLLTRLFLTGTRVTDAACTPISRMQGLKKVILNDTNISAESVERLRAQCPQVAVYCKAVPRLASHLARCDGSLADAAIAYIEQRQGRVRRLSGEVGNSSLVESVEWWLAPQYPIDDDIACLAMMPEFAKMRTLELSQAMFGDLGCESLAKFGELRDLYLFMAQIGDEGLAHLLALKRMERLDVSHCWISDRHLGRLVELPALRELNLTGTCVTDAGVERLAELQQLELLGLANTHVTDSCLAAIARLPRLRELSVSFTHVTPEGVRWLRSKRPDITSVSSGRKY